MRLFLVALLVPLSAHAAPALIDVPGGTFMMGDAAGEPDEAPRQATVAPFRIMKFEVTNRDFSAFVAASGHVTDPERRGFGYVWPGRWQRLAGADWRHPGGPEDAEIAADHPVVQVSWHDALAFCRFHGLRLPSEAEWEFAARGTDGRRYTWGDDAPSETRHANFGTHRCCGPDDDDGFLKTAPVGRYPDGTSPFGALDVAGNVWEWTASADGDTGRYIIKGGGWGNNTYCLRASYRHRNPPDIGLDMVGIRCAADAR